MTDKKMWEPSGLDDQWDKKASTIQAYKQFLMEYPYQSEVRKIKLVIVDFDETYKQFLMEYL